MQRSKIEIFSYYPEFMLEETREPTQCPLSFPKLKGFQRFNLVTERYNQFRWGES